MMETPVDAINVVVNGVKYNISNTSPKTSLNEWLRSQPGLKGTKVTCQEGGCGSCIVALTKQDLVTSKEKTIAVNSCLFPLFAADGFKITTTEGIGSSRSGYHPIQERIAEHNGSQCGYCTPGMVMNMYSLLSENAQPTKQEIEDSFDGNLCRCTGFRPILDAMKSFAKDEKPIDIEDLKSCQGKGNCCSETRTCHGCCFNMKQLAGPQWYKLSSLTDLYNILNQHSSNSVRLVGGNTGKGVYKNDGDFDVYISIADVPELNVVKVKDSALQLGAALSLNTVIRELLSNSEKSKSFDVLATHIKKIANVPVRNVGCWAGNLMLVHKHREFPSDMFTIMSAVGSTLTIGSVDGSTKSYSLEEFLSVDMQSKVILSISVPFSAEDEVVKAFKIMPRHQNAHAYVNAGFRASIDSSYTVQGTPSLVFGGVKLSSMRASETEQYLSGKSLLNSATLKGCLSLLDKEIVPESSPLAASVEYRKSLAISLFYKFYLALLGDKANERVRSAAVPYVRPISSGQQSYDTTASDYPLTEPMTKISAKLQASGEAQYTDDIPKQQGEVYGAFVTTSKGNCKIANVDTSEAINMPGVLKFITAKDIPGVNNFIGAFDSKETIFCDGEVDYAGQGVGVIIAVSQSLADEAAEKVKITYSDCKTPIVTVEDAIKAQSYFPDQIVNNVYGDPDGAMASSAHVISGKISLGTQHHFHMETHVCLCVPGDEGIEVYAATQYTDNTQTAIAQVLNMPQKSVHVSCKRCGGAYGGKAIREGVNSTACAVAAYVMNRPVRLRMNLKTNMGMVGKRFPYVAKYKVGVTEEGILNAVDMTFYVACGQATTEMIMHVPEMPVHVDNAYYCENWKFIGIPCKTNTATNASTRSPGTLPATFVTETMMNHVAKVLNKNPDQIREINFYKQGQTTYYKQPLQYCSISKIWQELKKSSEFDKRKAAIAQFNKANRWRKRGISLVPLRYGITWAGCRFTAYVAIFRKDGTVSISHGGVEMGQGINTKVCQVAAYSLGHSLTVDQISIRPATSFMNPNGATTRSSVTSELCCEAVLNCCTALKERIDPVAKDMPSATWIEIIEKCYSLGVDLSERYMVYPQISHQFNYNTYGSTCTEAEIDVLTGEAEILRTDILFDCGRSMNPEIDVGQVEGAFIMGLGYWLTEQAIYDPTTGLQLNTGTWDYHPPFSKDIPIDFRVSLLKDAPNPLGVLRSKGNTPTRKSPRLQTQRQNKSDIFIHPYTNGKVLQTADTLHNISSSESLSSIILMILSLDTENLYLPKKGLFWLRKGTKQLVALKNDEDMASCRREYGIKVPIKIACQCISSESESSQEKVLHSRKRKLDLGGSSTSKENELWNEVHVSLVRDLEKKGVMWRYNINHLKHWTDVIVDGKSSGVGDEPDWEKCIDIVHVPPKNTRSSGASSVNSESSSTPNSTVNQSLVNNNSPNLLELFMLQSQQRMEIEAKRADVFQSTMLAMMSSTFKTKEPIENQFAKPKDSTAVGEPPQCMSCSCLFAVQDAIYHAREEIGKDKDYFALDGPATVEATQLKCLVDPSQFVF